jgi:hypothetical protein
MALKNVTFSERLALALRFLAYYVMDKLDFMDYNPVRFHNNWEADWQLAISKAESFGSDENLVDEGTDRTAALNQTMEDSRQNYQRYIKPFVEDAFAKTKPGLMNSFGINNYDESRRTPARMILFLKNLSEKCAAYKTELLAVGINTTKVALIDTQHNELMDLYTNQSTFTGERSESARLRGEVFEALDEFTMQTARAGKNIYDVDTPKYRRYILYGSVKGSDAAKLYAVASQKTVNILEGKIDNRSGFLLTNSGKVNLTVYVGDAAVSAVPDTAITLAVGEKDLRVLAADLSEGVFSALVVKNEKDTDGAITVQLLKMIDDNE